MAKNIVDAFGKRIRELRKRRGWSQEEMARISGLHWTYIGGLERGERNLTLLSIHTIARAFKIKTYQLFKGID